ncbi:MAG TPA: hypothetical protein VLA36_04315 [Longimicrobiales bacterium]|nr:hypothetical protein [Longimicrobiales bacterium]
MSTYLSNKSAVPWWAAFGAPLLGVPLLVGLLALGSTGDDKGAGKEVESSYTTERSEALQASIELPPATMEASSNSRC